MTISRRNLFRHVVTGAVATAGLHALAETSFGAARGGVWLAEDIARGGGPIRLDRNENGYGPSRKVVAAMQNAAVDLANRYPAVEAERLRIKIAALHSVAPDQIVLGCGSTDIMRMAVNALIVPGKNLITALPTCDLIGRFALSAGAEAVAVALTAQYAHDLSGMLARAGAATGLVYICNPNNPTGSLTPRKDIEAFIRSLPETACVLIDEAYHHYVGKSADYASFIDRPLDDKRVIVARTFSKIYGLAGLRIGYAVAAAPIARRLAAYQLWEHVNVIAAMAAMTALDDTEHMLASANQNADDRQEFFNQVHARMVRAVDSQTNFVMINAGDSADDVIAHFKKNNIALSPCFPSFEKHIRISLGTQAEMQEFWRVWDLMPNHKMAM